MTPIDTPTMDCAITVCYAGKQSPTAILATPPAVGRLLWGDTQSPHLLCYGDNLPWLAFLLHHGWCGKIRLVFIDPPFATGQVYRTRSHRVAYHDRRTGAHALEFVRQRLVFLRELLADDGSIYVHLDHRLAFPVKLIMDEIFGPDNFRNWITRKKCHAKNATRRTYGNVSDYILFYTKSATYVWNRPTEPRTEEEDRTAYPYVEAETGRRYATAPLYAPGIRHGSTGTPWRGIHPPPGTHWQFPPSTLDAMDARGEIVWSSTGNPRRKVYRDTSNGRPVHDIWLTMMDTPNQHARTTGYPTEKNPDMIARIICASSHEGDIVLDCFSGSGTTLVGATALHRRWIGIDQSPEAIRATLHRFARYPDVPNHRETPTSRHHHRDLPPISCRSPITDFALYAAEPYSGEIDEIVVEWNRWLRQQRT